MAKSEGGAGGVRGKVSESVALGQVSAEVRALLHQLERDGYDLVHGLMQTRIFDSGKAVGGINRKIQAGYILDGVVTPEMRATLLGLGFEEMWQRSGARQRRYFQIAMTTGVEGMHGAVQLVSMKGR